MTIVCACQTFDRSKIDWIFLIHAIFCLPFMTEQINKISTQKKRKSLQFVVFLCLPKDTQAKLIINWWRLIVQLAKLCCVFPVSQWPGPNFLQWAGERRVSEMVVIHAWTLFQADLLCLFCVSFAYVLYSVSFVSSAYFVHMSMSMSVFYFIGLLKT